MNEQQLISLFENGGLDPARFDHEMHLRLAWAYLRREPLPEVMIRMRDGLRAFTAKLGVPQKYHETITFAFILLLHERRAVAGPDAPFDACIKGEPALSPGWQQSLGAWYERETLDSAEARRHFRLPDLLIRAVPGAASRPESEKRDLPQGVP